MHTLDPIAIGQRIRETRGKATQQEFASRLGVGRVSVARYETGERTPDAEFVARISVVCGVDPMWLLVGQQRPIEAREPTPSYAVPGQPPAPALSTREAELIDNYRRGADEDRRLIDGVARHVVKHPAMDVFDPEQARAQARRAADPRPIERPMVVGPRRRRVDEPEPKRVNKK